MYNSPALFPLLKPTHIFAPQGPKGEPMKNLADYVKTLTETPQSKPIPGSTQVPNSGGGYSWAVDDWVRLERFLILGAQEGTYYIAERKLTEQNAEAVARCIADDGPAVVARIVEISEAGRAPKNDPAVVALAPWVSPGRPPNQQAAVSVLARGCPTRTPLFRLPPVADRLRR